MNCGPGGIEQHPTLIKEKEGYLGPYHDPTNPRMIKIGKEQSLIWEESELCEGDGPINLSIVERQKQRHDQRVPIKLKKDQTAHEPKAKTRSELIAEIMKEDQRFTMMMGGRTMLGKKFERSAEEL